MYKKGDVVMHKASGQLGVITYKYIIGNCNKYDLSIDFGKDVNEVEEYLLKHKPYKYLGYP